MGDPVTAAVILSTAGSSLKAYGVYEGFKSEEANAKFQAGISRNNIKIIEQQKADLLSVGAQQAATLKHDTMRAAADQVTDFVSSGIDISSAVVGETIEETALVGASDIITAQKNFERQVWGLEIGKMNEQTNMIFQLARARRLKKLAPIATVTSLLGSTGPSPGAATAAKPTTTASGTGGGILQLESSLGLLGA